MKNKLKILVVDDEPYVTAAIRRCLVKDGYEVIEVNNPVKVEEYLLYTDLNLFILDVRMPGLDGLQVLKLIKKSRPELPVLILTGETSINTAVEATKLGAAEYLTKPVNNDILIKAVRDHALVDDALPDGMKEFIESSVENGVDDLAIEPDRILLKDEIVSTDTIPDGLVEIEFKDIAPGQFLSFALYLQIYNKANRRYYLKKISQENTVFTTGLKNLLAKRSLGSVFIRESDYKEFLEYRNAIRALPNFNAHRITDNKRLLLYGKAVEAISEILADPTDNKNLTAALELVDGLFKTILDDPVTYQDLFKLFKRDTTIFNHSANACLLAVSFGAYLGLKQEPVKVFGLGAMFHDVGMNRVDRHLLEKSGPLTRLEWEEIKKHPERGYSILKSARIIPVPALRIVLEHHEKPDGTGYPRGLKEDKIGELSRLFGIVDKFDAMTTTKPYRQSFSAAEALKRIYFEESTETFQRIIKRFIAFLGGK